MFPKIRTTIRNATYLVSKIIVLIISFFIFISSAVFASNYSSISSIEPDHVVQGKVTTIKVRLKKPLSNGNLVLSPGGPFVVNVARLQFDIKDIVSIRQDVLLVVGERDLYFMDISSSQPKIINRIHLSGSHLQVRFFDPYIYISSRESGIEIFKLEKKSSLSPMGVYSPKYPVTDFNVQSQKICLLLNKKNIAVIDTRNPEVPILSHEAVLKEPAQRIFATKNRCYVAGQNKMLSVYGFSLGNKLQWQGSIRTNGPVHDVIVKNEHAYIANGKAGFTLLDVKNPDRAVFVSAKKGIGNVVRVRLHQESAILLTDQSQLILISLNQKETPVIESSFYSETNLIDYLFDSNGVFAVSKRVLKKVNFFAVSSAALVNNMVNFGGSRRATITDNILYVADWFSGLHLYDISDPVYLRHIAHFHTQGSSKGVVVKNDFAFVGDDDHGLQIINIKDPNNLSRVAQLSTPGLAYTIKVIGNLLYLADHRGGFHIIDIANVLSPKILGSFDTPGKAWAVDVKDNVAYIADDTSGLLIFDIKNPKTINQIGQYDPGGYAEDVIIRKQYAFVTFFDKGLHILDISQPHQPILVSHIDIPGNARGIAIKGDNAYIAAWDAGLQFVDISTIKKPKLISYLDTAGSVWGVNIKGKYAYLLDWWGGIKIADISDTLDPKLVGQFPLKHEAHQLAIWKNYIFAAMGIAGLHVFDVKNPFNPIWATALTNEFTVISVVIAKNYLYAGTKKNGILIFDISNPYVIKPVQQRFLTGVIHHLLVVKNHLYVLNDDGDVFVFDIREPAKIRQIKKISGNVRAFHTYNKTQIALLDDIKGMIITDAAASTVKEQLLLTNLNDNFDLFAVKGNYFFLYKKNFGITVALNSGGRLHAKNFLSISKKILDLKILEDRMYLVISGELMSVNTSNPEKLVIETVYTLPKGLNKLTLVNDYAFLASRAPITTVKLLPPVNVRQSDPMALTLIVPDTMPMGTYNLSLQGTNNKTNIWYNAITVKRKNLKQPRLTQERFQELLKQRKLNHSEESALIQ